MSRPDAESVLRWRGHEVLDVNGEKLGRLGALYLDPEGDVPAWGGVRTGLFGRKESIVPLHHAVQLDGEDVRLAVTAEQVRAAPSVDPDAELTPDEEDVLRAHYGRSAELAEGEMVRHEEEVRVDVTPMQPAERVRLRKVLVTEEVTQTVPVRKEVIQLETDPPPAGTVESVEDAGPDATPGTREL